MAIITEDFWLEFVESYGYYLDEDGRATCPSFGPPPVTNVNQDQGNSSHGANLTKIVCKLCPETSNYKQTWHDSTEESRKSFMKHVLVCHLQSDRPHKLDQILHLKKVWLESAEKIQTLEEEIKFEDIALEMLGMKKLDDIETELVERLVAMK